MKYFSLVWAQLFRSKTRTLLTLLSVVAAFLLFGMLDSVRVAFNSGGDTIEGAKRLVVSSKLSITQSLPLRLLRDIEATPGVRKVNYAMWFGGIYQDQKNFFPSFSVSDNYMDLYPEFELPPEQAEAFKNTRTGALVGEALAKRFGWKVGDTIPMQATIFPRKGSNDWPLVLSGIYRAKDRNNAGAENQMMLHWSYFDESNDYIKNQVSFYTVQLENPAHASRVAQAIDALSLNSDHETKSQTEASFSQAFAKQFADIGLIVTGIMAAVFFTLVLLTGNTMAQAVRERIPELAILKDGTVLVLVMVESVLLIVLGGLIGMGLASIVMPVISASSQGMISLPGVPAQTWVVALCLMAVIGIVVGLLPALRAQRLKIVDALAGR